MVGTDHIDWTSDRTQYEAVLATLAPEAEAPALPPREATVADIDTLIELQARLDAITDITLAHPWGEDKAWHVIGIHGDEYRLLCGRCLRAPERRPGRPRTRRPHECGVRSTAHLPDL